MGEIKMIKEVKQSRSKQDAQGLEEISAQACLPPILPAPLPSPAAPSPFPMASFPWKSMKESNVLIAGEKCLGVICSLISETRKRDAV